jgi:hypothetical protein
MAAIRSFDAIADELQTRGFVTRHGTRYCSTAIKRMVEA